MAEQHRFRRHGRTAIASRVRCDPTGTQEIEYLCEIDLAEERMSGRLLLRERKEEGTAEPTGSRA